MALAPSGGDDTAAIQAVFDTGGDVPPGTYHVRGPIFYHSEKPVTVRGTLVYDRPQEGWESAFLICGAGYRQNPRPRLGNVTLDFSGGGKIICPEHPRSDPPRKGIGITFTDGFRLIEPWVEGENGNNLFALQLRDSSHGLVLRGYASNRTSHEGADGFHLIGVCRDVVIDGLVTAAADDASSQTLETVAEKDRVIERISYRNCFLKNFQHSAIKTLILATVGDASVIRDIDYYNCDLVTIPSRGGAGTPIECRKENPLCTIEKITIRGGRLRVSLPNPQQLIHGPLITLKGIDDFSLVGTDVEFFSRQLISAVDSPRITFQPSEVRVTPRRIVPRPSTPIPLISLTRSPDAIIDHSKLSPTYADQPIVVSS